MTSDHIVTEARSWLGTAYRRQQRAKGLATDCVGFVCGVLVAVGAAPADAWSREFVQHATYAKHAPDGLVVAAMRLVMSEIEPAVAGPADVVVMRLPGQPQHLALLTPYPLGGVAVIHAWFGAGRVVEHQLDTAWRARITHAFRIPGVEA